MYNDSQKIVLENENGDARTIDVRVSNDWPIGLLAESNDDGEIFMAFKSENSAVVALPDGESWILETLLEDSAPVALAVSADSIAVVTLEAARYTLQTKIGGEDWISLTLSDVTLAPPFAAMRWDNDTLKYAWFKYAEDGGLHLTTIKDGAMTTVRLKEEIIAVADSRPLGLAMNENYLAFSNGDSLKVGKLEDDVWTELPEVDSVRFFGFNNGVSLSEYVNGNPVVLYSDIDFVHLAEWNGTSWNLQKIYGDCNDWVSDLVVDTNDDLVIAHACEQNVNVLRKAELYPEDYLASCEELKDKLCDTIPCGSAEYCFGGSANSCGNQLGCRLFVESDACADATRDPKAIPECIDGVDNLMCGVPDDNDPEEIPLILDGACESAFSNP